MKRKYKVTDIIWDSDNETINAPKETTIEFDEDLIEEDEVEMAICDYLSDTFGYLVESFIYKRI